MVKSPIYTAIHLKQTGQMYTKSVVMVMTVILLHSKRKPVSKTDKGLQDNFHVPNSAGSQHKKFETPNQMRVKPKACDRSRLFWVAWASAPNTATD